MVKNILPLYDWLLLQIPHQTLDYDSTHIIDRPTSVVDDYISYVNLPVTLKNNTSFDILGKLAIVTDNNNRVYYIIYYL